MTGHRALRCALFGALLSFSAGSFAQQIVTTSDLIQQPGYQASWQNMVKGRRGCRAGRVRASAPQRRRRI